MFEVSEKMMSGGIDGVASAHPDLGALDALTVKLAVASTSSSNLLSLFIASS